jgi:uncharacterized protein (DUF849 family)
MGILGDNARIGMENTLCGETEKLTSGDDELVDKAISIIKQLGGAVASPDEARSILGLEKRNHAKL